IGIRDCTVNAVQTCALPIFTYDEKRDCFICPVGKVLSYQTIQRKGKQKLYARSGCSQCAQQSACTKADKRWITRHFHEGALEQADRKSAGWVMMVSHRSLAT